MKSTIEELIRDYESRMEAEQNILNNMDKDKLPNQASLTKGRISVISQIIKDLQRLQAEEAPECEKCRALQDEIDSIYEQQRREADESE